MSRAAEHVTKFASDSRNTVKRFVFRSESPAGSGASSVGGTASKPAGISTGSSISIVASCSRGDETPGKCITIGVDSPIRTVCCFIGRHTKQMLASR